MHAVLGGWLSHTTLGLVSRVSLVGWWVFPACPQTVTTPLPSSPLTSLSKSPRLLRAQLLTFPLLNALPSLLPSNSHCPHHWPRVHDQSQNCPIHTTVSGEAAAVICQALHFYFISNLSLCKLVHFQTYNPLLLPMMVDHVPSLHVCFDFIPELLHQNNIKQQAFAIKLAAELMRSYTITRAVECAKLVCSKVCPALCAMQ